jgi:hypothetical protein
MTTPSERPPCVSSPTRLAAWEPLALLAVLAVVLMLVTGCVYPRTVECDVNFVDSTIVVNLMGFVYPWRDSGYFSSDSETYCQAVQNLDEAVAQWYDMAGKDTTVDRITYQIHRISAGSSGRSYNIFSTMGFSCDTSMPTIVVLNKMLSTFMLEGEFIEKNGQIIYIHEANGEYRVSTDAALQGSLYPNDLHAWPESTKTVHLTGDIIFDEVDSLVPVEHLFDTGGRLVVERYRTTCQASD